MRYPHIQNIIVYAGKRHIPKTWGRFFRMIRFIGLPERNKSVIFHGIFLYCVFACFYIHFY